MSAGLRKVFTTGKVKRVLDSGSDEHIRGRRYHPCRNINIPITFDTVKGMTTSNQVMDVNIPGGEDTAYYLEGSVDVDSLGRIVHKKRKAFLWDPDYFSELLLFDPSDLEHKLRELRELATKHKTCDVEVEGYVPIVCMALNRNEEDEANTELNNMFDLDGKAQYDTTDSSKDVMNQETYAHAAPALTKDHHLTHVPANPDKCEFCRIAKKKKFPARRLKEDKAVYKNAGV